MFGLSANRKLRSSGAHADLNLGNFNPVVSDNPVFRELAISTVADHFR
jgi:hypothetical protein